LVSDDTNAAATLSYDSAQDGFASARVDMRLLHSTAQPHYIDASFNYSGTPQGVGISQEFSFTLYDTLPNAPFYYLNLKATVDLPSLRWKETLLPDAVDEYGRVKEDRVVVTDLHWIASQFTSQSGYQEQAPVLNHRYSLYNCSNSYGGPADPKNPDCRAVKGVEFDMESYSSCINSKTGIH
jgi:hypothetical protein